MTTDIDYLDFVCDSASVAHRMVNSLTESLDEKLIEVMDWPYGHDRTAAVAKITSILGPLKDARHALAKISTVGE